MRLGSDTGGTFTDLVADDGRIAKVPSTPDDPGDAVRTGIASLTDGAADALDLLTHGTTIATNALLERKGAKVALVTNEGFADIIEIARQDRPSLYDPTIDRPVPLVPRAWRYEVRGRLDAAGGEVTPLDLATLAAIDPTVEAVAVCLLHSDRNPTHEQVVAAALRERGLDVTASHELSPEFREYERTVTTVANAYLRPRCRAYLAALGTVAPSVQVMSSAGGLIDAAVAADQPARLLLSGPAGGVVAAARVAAVCGYPDALTLDMGGTSTDVCLVSGGRPEPAAEREVAGFTLRLPALDVETIGAGGGSLARIDTGGALVVGPESAGAVPGPACYGRGGTRPTVTDADLVLGRIPSDHGFPGLGRLDVDAARRAIEAAGVTAEGIVRVVDEHMVQALRKVSVERGVDPRRRALVVFGGAGPLHGCALAEAIGIATVIVPPRAGVLSAVGILGADLQTDVVESWPGLADHDGVDARLASIGQQAIDRLGDHASAEVVVATALDCRYAGQSFELRVPSVDAFPAEHERRNGYRRDGHPIEVVALRATARVASGLTIEDLPVIERTAAVGPAVIAEPDCTIWVADGWSAEPHPSGALVLSHAGAPS